MQLLEANRSVAIQGLHPQAGLQRRCLGKERSLSLRISDALLNALHERRVSLRDRSSGQRSRGIVARRREPFHLRPLLRALVLSLQL